MAQPAPFERRREPPPGPDPGERAEGRGLLSRAGRLLAVGVMFGALWLVWHLGSSMIAQVNRELGPQRDPLTGKIRGDQDQKHNVNQAVLAMQRLTGQRDDGQWGPSLTAWLPAVTDGVVGPLWPWVAARLAEPDHYYDELRVSRQDRSLFERGKWLNLTLTVVFAGILGLVLFRSMHPAAALCILLAGTFGALLPRAVYFQPEPLFYIFFFLSWVCAMRLMTSNPLWLHAVFGIVAGLGYLAKASMEPLVAGWLVMTAVRGVREWRRRDAAPGPEAWSLARAIGGVAVFALFWMIVVGPRYAYASDRWGDPRHTYPGYWMWFDRFEECYRWMADHPDRKSLESLQPSERPSLSNYVRTHSWNDIRDRLTGGISEKVTSLVAPKRVRYREGRGFSGWKHLLELRGTYLGAMAAVLIGAGAVVLLRRRGRDAPGGALPFGTVEAVLFAAGTTAGYVILYGWYTPIGRGDRFMLSLYLPLVYCLVRGADTLMRVAVARNAPRWTTAVCKVGLWAVNAAIVWRLAEVLRVPVFDPGTT